jgi:glycine dehydrogenase subunit 1
LMGKEGLKRLAQLNLDKAEFTRQTLEKIPGVVVKRSSPTFNEFTVEFKADASRVVSAMVAHGFAAGFPLSRYYPGMENYMTIAVTEKRTLAEIKRYADCLKDVLKKLK